MSEARQAVALQRARRERARTKVRKHGARRYLSNLLNLIITNHNNKNIYTRIDHRQPKRWHCSAPEHHTSTTK